MYNRRIWILVVVSLMMVPAVLAISAAGCGQTGIIVFDCNYPLEGRIATNTGERDDCCHDEPCPCHCLNDPCPDESEKACDAGTDAAPPDGGTSSCSGECVPLPPAVGWEGPYLLSLSPEGMAPACPAEAPVAVYEGHDGLNAPPAACGTCACTAPSGTCAPPLTMTSSSKPCGDSSGATTAFNGPPAWDGACTAHDCISPDPACTHPLNSIQSLTVAPLALTEQGCTPSIVIAKDASAPTWTTAARACRGMATVGLVCSDPGQTCVPAAVPPEFAMCIYHEGDMAWPSAYPVKHVVYAGLDDQRTCSDCACSAPGGGSCTGALSVFKDGACSVPLLGSLPISSAAPSCVDLVPAGLPLGSKTIIELAYQPGTCMPSGGEPSGTIEAADPSTFCCLMS